MEHKHGGDPQADFARFSITEKPLLDFSVNLNPLGPPDIIRDHWMDLLKTVTPYPSAEGDGIASYYQSRFDLSRDNVLAGNGSTEMIYLIPRVLGIKKVFIFTPSFYDYERSSKIASADISSNALLAENEFSFPKSDQMLELIKEAGTVWIGRPNNPTGTFLSKENILELAEYYPDKRFIIDEAFIQFMTDWEQKTLLNEDLRSNILILHSLTKFYALAGLRMGAVVASDSVIARLKKAKEPWTVNGIADRIAPLLIDCQNYEMQTLSLITQERKRVYQKLQKLGGIKAFLCTANFFLCQWQKTRNLDELIHHLLRNGIYIRDCRNFPGLEDNFFRFGLRSFEDNDRLLHLLETAS